MQSNFTKPYWFVFGPLLLASSVRFYRERTNDALAGARTYKPWKRLTHYQFYFFARSSLLSKTVHFRLACNVKNTECLASTFDMKFERSSKQLEFKAQLFFQGKKWMVTPFSFPDQGPENNFADLLESDLRCHGELFYFCRYFHSFHMQILESSTRSTFFSRKASRWSQMSWMTFPCWQTTIIEWGIFPISRSGWKNGLWLICNSQVV